MQALLQAKKVTLPEPRKRRKWSSSSRLYLAVESNVCCLERDSGLFRLWYEKILKKWVYHRLNEWPSQIWKWRNADEIFCRKPRETIGILLYFAQIMRAKSNTKPKKWSYSPATPLPPSLDSIHQTPQVGFRMLILTTTGFSDFQYKIRINLYNASYWLGLVDPKYCAFMIQKMQDSDSPRTSSVAPTLTPSLLGLTSFVSGSFGGKPMREMLWGRSWPIRNDKKTLGIWIAKVSQLGVANYNIAFCAWNLPFWKEYLLKTYA